MGKASFSRMVVAIAFAAPLTLLIGSCAGKASRTIEAGGGSSASGGSGQGSGGVPNLECQAVLCDPITCVSGTHIEVLPGECCETCVPDLSCDEGRQKYDEYFVDLFTKRDSGPCQVDGDCVVIPLGYPCYADCGAGAVNVTWARSISDELNAYARLKCAACPVTSVDCPPISAICVVGRCGLNL